MPYMIDVRERHHGAIQRRPRAVQSLSEARRAAADEVTTYLRVGALNLNQACLLREQANRIPGDGAELLLPDGWMIEVRSCSWRGLAYQVGLWAMARNPNAERLFHHSPEATSRLLTMFNQRGVRL